MATTLFVRNLDTEVNAVLDWYKGHFAVSTNTTAAVQMITDYKQLYRSKRELEQKVRELEGKLDLIQGEYEKIENSKGLIKSILNGTED